MIPKTIHYCWFGGKPLNDLAVKCIESWKKYCPDYEIVEWNESNCDISAVKYTAQAYEKQKYAFVSDYFRFEKIYNEGGIYLDTDVELLKPLDDLLTNECYLGFEDDLNVAAGLGCGAVKGNTFFREICAEYKKREFLKADGNIDYTTVVKIVTDILEQKGLKKNGQMQCVDGCTIYPAEFFQPIDLKTQKAKITGSTYSIHHYAASWYSPAQNFKRRCKKIFIAVFGPKLFAKIFKRGKRVV